MSIRSLFDSVMRLHARMFLTGVLGLFVVGEVWSRPLASFLAQCWLLTMLACFAVAWLLQRKLYAFVASNPARYMHLAFAYSKHRIPLPGEIPIWYGGEIPHEIITAEPNARLFLNAAQKIPFMSEISRTQFDYNPLRFSWLRAESIPLPKLLEVLKAGDQILYHRNGSLVGWIIRLTTRSYWEHTAMYVGSGEVLDVAPGGVQRVPLGDWVENPKVELAIIRATGTNLAAALENALSKEGGRYNYSGVFREFWKISTGQYGPQGLQLLRVIAAMAISLAFMHLFSGGADRMQIAASTLPIAYVIDAIWHPLAYNPNFEQYFQLLNGGTTHEQS